MLSFEGAAPVLSHSFDLLESVDATYRGQ